MLSMATASPSVETSTTSSRPYWTRVSESVDPDGLMARRECSVDVTIQAVAEHHRLLVQLCKTGSWRPRIYSLAAALYPLKSSTDMRS